MKQWYMEEAVDVTPIISSRVRLARNIGKYPFLVLIDDEQSKNMIQEASERLTRHFTWVTLGEKNEVEKLSLLERHMISPEFLKIEKPKGLLLQEDEKVSIMLNEEDHVRVQAIAPGNDIDSAWNTANKVDDLIEENVEYAFDKDYGYLTSCPTNTGTGLRASFMAHLPMLEKTGHIKNILSAVTKFGITLRGIYGEGTEPLGHVFQISNQVTLGKSEEEIINSLKNVTTQIIDNENWLRQKALSDKRTELADRVYRSYGTLAYSRKLSSREAMELLSDVRLGYMTGLLEMQRPRLTLYQIMMSIQSGSLQLLKGRALDEQERDVARADYLRTIFTA